MLEDFVKKVRLASKTNQKTITLPIEDAVSIVYNLNIILLNLLDKKQNEQEEAANEVIRITMDGGGFNDKQ